MSDEPVETIPDRSGSVRAGAWSSCRCAHALTGTPRCSSQARTPSGVMGIARSDQAARVAGSLGGLDECLQRLDGHAARLVGHADQFRPAVWPRGDAFAAGQIVALAAMVPMIFVMRAGLWTERSILTRSSSK
ncbi:MAG: hypothetical protein M5U09_28005 [Gammaproteobacteria bacterium]|nr:hypothetical protein [Gammaproteobacteria bacterium]